jgi:alpha-galactosidase
VKPSILLNLFSAVVVASTCAPPALAVEPLPADFEQRSAWINQHFSRKSRPPISFVYGAKPGADDLRRWTFKKLPPVLPLVGRFTPDAIANTFTYTDPPTGLRVRIELLEFRGHPAIEWVVYIKNSGREDSPLLTDIQALDSEFPATGSSTVFHYAKGALCSPDDFEPMTDTLKPGARVRLEPAGGRSSSDYLPFFNLESPPRGGLIAGLGWSGEWALALDQVDLRQTRLRAGMALTHLKLRPGEEIRTPRVALLFYQGGWIRGQNLWRKFLLDTHRPQVDGQPLTPPILNGNWGATPAAMHLQNIEAITSHNLPIEFYWIDAEWFGQGPWWVNPGDWRLKSDLYPDGLKPLSDALHRSGRKLLLWFEPERVCEKTPWFKEHPEWLLETPTPRRVYNWGDRHTFPEWTVSESRRNQINDGDRLFNLGNPQARQFLTDFIGARIAEFGLDCYRHDANIAPLEFWRAADAPDRQGITEIRWVEGLYAFWDELLRRYPHLVIDNCASGGRRIDLETLSRSTPFWRSDYRGNLTANQCHSYGLSFWAPLHSTGDLTPGRDSDYQWRSGFSSMIVVNLFGNGDARQVKPAPADFPFDKAKAALEQYRFLQPCFLGDYYPLTPYSKAPNAWLAWQFHRADLGRGLIQAFRRPEAKGDSRVLRLQGLSPTAFYSVRNLDEPIARRVSGRELLEQGIALNATTRPSAFLVTYELAK